MDFTIENWLTVITVVFAAIGGCFALFRWAENNKIKCAEFYFQVVDKLNCDSKVVQTMYMITYGETDRYAKTLNW